MSTNNLKKLLKIHCDSSEEDSDSGLKSNLDAIYKANKPPPIPINENTHNIIEIGNNNKSKPKTKNVCSSKNKDLNHNSETNNLSKSQRKRRRKKILSEINKKEESDQSDISILNNSPAIPLLKTRNVNPINHTSYPDVIPSNPPNKETHNSLKHPCGIISQNSTTKTKETESSDTTTRKRKRKKKSKTKNIQPINTSDLKDVPNATLTDTSLSSNISNRERIWSKLIDNPELMKPLSKNEDFMKSLIDINSKNRDGSETSKDEVVNEVADLIFESYSEIEKAEAEGKKPNLALTKEKKENLQPEDEGSKMNSLVLKQDVIRLFIHLGDYIISNSTNTGGIFQQIDKMLNTLHSWNIPYSRSICCISTMIRKTVWIFNNCLQFAQRWTLNFKQLFYDVESVILESVMEHNYESELTGPRHPLEIQVFNSFNDVYTNSLMRFSTTIYYMIRLLYINNPLVYIVQAQAYESDKRFFYLSLARNIVYKRTHLQVVMPPLFNPPVTNITPLNKTGTPFIQNLPQLSYINHFNLQIQELQDNYKASQINCRDTLLQLDKFTAELMYQDKTLKANKKQTVDAKSQNQLQDFVIEDLTENRRYFYDGSYFENNMKAWRDFQDLYLNESISKSELEDKSKPKLPKSENLIDDLTKQRRLSNDGIYFEENKQIEKDSQVLYLNESNQIAQVEEKLKPKSPKPKKLKNQLLDDVTKNRRYFYDGSYFGKNMKAWRDFQDSYLNGSISLSELEEKSKTKKPENQLCLVDNLTKHRRLSNEGIYFEENKPIERDSRVLYLNESNQIAQVEEKLKPKSPKRKKLKNQLLDDVTKNRRYFYDGSYSADAKSWIDFQEMYFNCNLDSNLIKQENHTLKKKEIKKTDLETIDVSGNDESVVDLNLTTCDSTNFDLLTYPFLCLLESDKVRHIFLGLLFVIFFKKAILWSIICVYVIVSVSDITILLLVLLYLCIYFVIKF